MPPIQIPVNDTLETLQNVLKRQAEALHALSKMKVLSRGDYRQMEDKYDKISFIQPDDADSTKASIYYTRRKWTRYALQKEQHEGEDWAKLTTTGIARTKGWGPGSVLSVLRRAPKER
jgi:16S rRNA C1402 N4-methylase RsmH